MDHHEVNSFRLVEWFFTYLWVSRLFIILIVFLELLDIVLPIVMARFVVQTSYLFLVSLSLFIKVV
jgi:hypothetical protein